MSDMVRIKAKLHKLLALARQGVGGEKDNAQSVLDKLLKRHGMTITDLDDANATRETRWFKPKNKQEKALLLNCVCMTLNTHTVTSWRMKRGRDVGYDLTNVEHAQVELLFTIHRRAWAKYLAKQTQNALVAYVSKNRLFPAADAPDDERPSKLSLEDMAAIHAMMAALQPTPVHKAITHAGAA